MRKFYLLILAGTLTACTSAPPEKLTKINEMQIPVMQETPSKNSLDSAQALSLYHENSLKIAQVTQSLKTEYLQDTTSKDIFDEHSEAHQAYVSLSRLEQFQQVNRYYFKQQNTTGLQNIQASLSSLN